MFATLKKLVSAGMGQQGAKANVPLHGIKLSAFAAFAEEFMEQDISGLCNLVIKPMTLEKRCSLAELWLSLPDKRDCVKPLADVFVSYAWKYKVRDLIDALTSAKGENPDRYIWLDCLVVNQHTSSDVRQDQWMETFSNALVKIGKAELIMVPWRQPIPATRAWCVFEHYILTSRSVPFVARITAADEKEFEQQIRSGDITIDTFLNVFIGVNIEKAEAFVPADRAAILALVQKVGVAKVNEASMGSIKTWLVNACRRVAEGATGVDGVEAARTMAQLEFALGNLQAALPWYKKAVEIANEVYGPESDLTAVQLNNLGTCYGALGMHTESREMHAKALEIRRREYPGPPNELVCISLNNLGGAYQAAGDFEKALEIYKEALDGQRVIHADVAAHAAIAQCLNNIGSSLYRLKRYDEALESFREATNLWTTALGEDHTEVLTGSANIAMTLGQINRFEEALDIHKKVLAARERIYGEDHLEVALAHNSIGVAYTYMKRPSDALVHQRRALQIFQQNSGENSPNVALTLNNIATSLADLGQLDEARKYGKRAYASYLACLGPSHPDTLFVGGIWNKM